MARQPEGYHTLNPILHVDDAATALGFYESAFGAAKDFSREMEGRLLIAVILIGDSRVMISDRQNEPGKAQGPRVASLELKIYVDDLEETFRRALAAGATEQEPISEKYWGERMASVIDPFGFTWRLAQYLEEVPHEEIERRMRQESGKT